MSSRQEHDGLQEDMVAKTWRLGVSHSDLKQQDERYWD